MTRSEALASLLGRRAQKLEHLCDRIISCHVVVELEGHERHHAYKVTVNLGLPGHEILVSHAAKHAGALESVEAVADRAFDEVARQLEDWIGRMRVQRHGHGGGDEAAHRDR